MSILNHELFRFVTRTYISYFALDKVSSPKSESYIMRFSDYRLRNMIYKDKLADFQGTKPRTILFVNEVCHWYCLQ